MEFNAVEFCLPIGWECNVAGFAAGSFPQAKSVNIVNIANKTANLFIPLSSVFSQHARYRFQIGFPIAIRQPAVSSKTSTR